VLCGWKRSMEVLPALLVAGLLMSVTQFLISHFSGPWTAGILSGIVTLAGLWLFLKVWAPRRTWDFPERSDAAAEGAASETGRASVRDGEGSRRQDDPAPKVSARAALRAWLPYLLMSVMVLLWSLGPLVPLLRHGDISFPWPGRAGVMFVLPIASTPGTAIFLAALISAFILPNVGLQKALVCLAETITSLGGTILTVCLVLATAFVMNVSGMSVTLGSALAATGALFPLFSPFLGWLGVLVTGSDTSSNALLGRCSGPRRSGSA
jgi:lactate permease